MVASCRSVYVRPVRWTPVGALAMAHLMHCAPLNAPGSDRGVVRVSSTQTILPTGRRHALLIANHDYDDDAADLNNPAKDVELVAKALQEVSFEALTFRRNLKSDQIVDAIEAFAKTLQEGDEAFFYYSGHGIAMRDRRDRGFRNYLLGTAFRARDETEAVSRGDVLPVDEVVRRLEDAPARIRIIVVDACRNQPFTRGWPGAKGVNDRMGFMAMNRVGEGTFLAFSSRQGGEALDGVRGYATGPYAHALSRHIQSPNVGIRDVFGAVGSDVRRITQKAQWPDYRDALDGQYYFKRVRILPPPPPPTVASRTQRGPAAVSQPPLAQRRPSKPRRSPEKPAWADQVGEDRYGIYADVVIPGSKAGFRMRLIPAGTFTMGSPESEEGRDADEREHKVTLTKGFWMADAECTHAVYQAVTGKSPSRFTSDDRPVEQVSWNDAQGFLRSLNQKIPGLHARLPTEAEWEYAARAGEGAARYGELDAIAWFDDNADRQTHPVRQKQPNAWGLYDMLGNVFEWNQDWFAEYDSQAQQDPKGPKTGVRRVIRGGSWFDYARDCRAAYRGAIGPSHRDDYLGFRFVRGQAAPGGGPEGP